MNFKTTQLILNGVFMSLLLYGVTLWIGAPSYLKRKIQSLQLEACRVAIGFKSMRWSTKKLLDTMGWVNLEQLLQRASAFTSHTIIHQGQPAQLSYRMREMYNRVNTTVNPIKTRMTRPNRLGSKPRMVGRTCFTRYHYRANAFEVYSKLPDKLTDIKKNLFVQKVGQKIPSQPPKLTIKP